MAKARKNSSPTPEEKVDVLGRVLQAIAIIAVVVIIMIDSGANDIEVPLYVPAGLMGVAIGLSPEQLAEIVKSILRVKK